MILTFTAIKLVQPIGELFLCRLPAKELVEIARADIRRINDREMETMSGIQRALSTSRISEIRRYIETTDAAFPNSVILNLNSEYLASPPIAFANPCDGGVDIYCFSIEKHEKAFGIIDGQHRISGFVDSDLTPFDLVVTFFVDLAVEDQAYLFSTINVTHQKVNKSLVYDLFGLSESRSPQRTAHLLTKALNIDPDSPLYRRIKMLGVSPKFGDEILYRAPLSQGTVADRILKLISDNPARDRDTLKRGEQIPIDKADVNSGLIFRVFFAQDQDSVILRVLVSYFTAISRIFPNQWNDMDNPLSKTIGFGALLRLLVDIFIAGMSKQNLSLEFFEAALSKLRERMQMDGVDEFSFNRYPASGSGETQLYRDLSRWFHSS
jgi:DGQHR domain-containing protein